MQDNQPENISKCPMRNLLYRPKSSRQGVDAPTYVYWNSMFHTLQYFNRTLARDPYNKNSWDTCLARFRFCTLRLNCVTTAATAR